MLFSSLRPLGFVSVFGLLRPLGLLAVLGLLGLAGFAACAPPTPYEACAQGKTPEQQKDLCTATQGEFVILTYNVHGLPAPITGDDTPGRMTQISPRLNAFDIAALQENFAHSDLLMAEIKHPFVDHADTPLEGRAYPSGLSVVSKLKILEHHHAPWEACFGTVSNANDCLAAKGFQRVRIALHPDHPSAWLDIYNLHMDAGGSQDDHAARLKQITQLVSAIEKHSKDGPIFIIGDTNMRRRIKDGRSEADGLDRILKEASVTESCPALQCPEDDHIDRVFFRSSSSVSITPKEWKRDTSFVDSKGTDLSDHPALSVRFQWSRPTPPLPKP